MRFFKLSTAALLSFTFVLTFLVGQINGQSGPSADVSQDWMRVRSNDGDFSIEVPARHTYFKNLDGFVVYADGQDRLMSDVHMIRGNMNGTFITLEVYNADKSVVDLIYEDDKRINWQKLSKTKRGKVDIKQLKQETDKFYAVAHYISYKNKIYILTAASRKGATAEITRFLNYSFEPAQAGDGSVAFKELKFDDVEFEILPEEKVKAPTPKPAQQTKPAAPLEPSLIMLRVPRASYVDTARINKISGAVRLKLTLSAEGHVPSVKVVRSLPDGLLRQALFAALRFTFLPKEENGVPVPVIKTLDYTFKIY